MAVQVLSRQSPGCSERNCSALFRKNAFVSNVAQIPKNSLQVPQNIRTREVMVRITEDILAIAHGVTWSDSASG